MPDSLSDQPSQETSPQDFPQPLSPPKSTGVPAPDSDSRVIKAVLITVAIFVGLGVIAVGVIGAGVWYLARSVHNVPSATFTARDLGIVIYPGAEPSLRGSRAEIAGTTMLKASYFTSDSADKVIAFYKEKAGPDATLITTSQSSGFRLTTATGDVTTVKIARVPDESGGKTYFMIEHVTKIVTSH
jgi:hypothetical protein